MNGPQSMSLLTSLYAAWWRAIDEAAREVEAGALGELSRSLDQQTTDKIPESLKELAESMRQEEEGNGESGTVRLVDGKRPRDIGLSLANRVDAGQIPWA